MLRDEFPGTEIAETAAPIGASAVAAPANKASVEAKFVVAAPGESELIGNGPAASSPPPVHDDLPQAALKPISWVGHQLAGLLRLRNAATAGPVV